MGKKKRKYRPNREVLRQHLAEIRKVSEWTDLAEWASKLDRAVAGTWRWFATLTFRKDIESHRAHLAVSRLKCWLSAWKDSRQPFTSVLWSAEPHNRGTVHIHALLTSTTEMYETHCKRCKLDPGTSFGPDWRRLNNSWYLHNGIGRFWPYDKKYQMGAERYVTKYCLKPDCLDWNFWEHRVDFGHELLYHPYRKVGDSWLK